jgi:type II secretory pathway predicted ATPase ExeA
MFQVDWLRSALDDLARLWNQSDSSLRQAIRTASNEIDRRLKRDALNEGESRAGNRRITFVPPLAAVFRIEKDGRTVSVLELRMFRRRAK